MHRAVLTNSIRRSRAQYLYGQWQRGHADTIEEAMTKAVKSLPVRRGELEGLREDFENYASTHELAICQKCGHLQCVDGEWEVDYDNFLCYECNNEEDNE